MLEEYNKWSSKFWYIENSVSNGNAKDAEEERAMHSWSDYIKVTSYNDVNEVVDELFDSLYSRYPKNLETSMRGSDFIFDSFQLMY